MTTTTYTATFRHTTATRTSEAAYTHASLSYRGGKARFHTSEAAARKAAGADGQVVAVSGAAPRRIDALLAEAPPTCSVCGDGGKVYGVSGHPEFGKVHAGCIAAAKAANA